MYPYNLKTPLRGTKVTAMSTTRHTTLDLTSSLQDVPGYHASYLTQVSTRRNK